MAYQVLSRKWRPQRFEEVVGQQHVTATLQNSIAQERLAHAYLFTGPRGIGKTTTARILAKYLNCKNPSDLNPCNECKNCKEITAGRSFDVLEIDGASNNGVENIRELREAVKYPPTDGKYRVYIIDEVHMLSNSAFNALLKTLEEPPEHVKFIFATTEPEAVLPTIISRTQRFDFKRIPLPKIIELLETICDSEGIEISRGALTLIAKKADGGMRDAESLLDQVISFAGGDITDENVASILGVVNYDLYIQLSEILQEHDVPGVIALVTEVLSTGYDLSEFLAGLADFWRNLMILSSTKDPTLMEVPEAYHESFQSTAEKFETRDLLRLLNLTLSAQQQFRDSQNHRLFVENFLIRLAHLDTSVRIDELLSGAPVSGSPGGSSSTNPPERSVTGSAGTEQKPKSESGPKRRVIGSKRTRIKSSAKTAPKDSPQQTTSKVSETEQTETGQSDATNPTLQNIQEKWNDFTKQVTEKHGFLGQYLSESEPRQADNKRLVLLFDRSQEVHKNRVEEKIRETEDVVQEYFGHKFRVKCRLGELEKPEGAEDEDIIDDPITQAIITEFNGEIVK